MLIEAGVTKWHCFTIVPMGRAKGNDELQLSDEQLKQLMDFIVATREEGEIDLSYACEGFLGDYEMKVRRYKFRCQAGLNTASVLSNGDISGCLSIRSQYHQGNIYRDSFWDVWANRFGKYRNHEWMKTGKSLFSSNNLQGSNKKFQEIWEHTEYVLTSHHNKQ